MADYFIGADIGQSQDYTALVILEKIQTPSRPDYHARHIMRCPLGMPYPSIVDQIVATYGHRRIRDSHRALIVDATGCGRPIVDLLKPCGPIAVTLHGGQSVTHKGRDWHVPKRDVVTCAQVLLQQRRLKFAEGVPLTPVLQQELLDFRYKINPLTAHDSYAAWREGQYDDLVLALSLACWWAERGPKPARVALIDVPPAPRWY